jgi:hypothetical protein
VITIDSPAALSVCGPVQTPYLISFREKEPFEALWKHREIIALASAPRTAMTAIALRPAPVRVVHPVVDRLYPNADEQLVLPRSTFWGKDILKSLNKLTRSL